MNTNNLCNCLWRMHYLKISIHRSSFPVDLSYTKWIIKFISRSIDGLQLQSCGSKLIPIVMLDDPLYVVRCSKYFLHQMRRSLIVLTRFSFWDFRVLLPYVLSGIVFYDHLFEFLHIKSRIVPVLIFVPYRVIVAVLRNCSTRTLTALSTAGPVSSEIQFAIQFAFFQVVCTRVNLALFWRKGSNYVKCLFDNSRDIKEMLKYFLGISAPRLETRACWLSF